MPYISTHSGRVWCVQCVRSSVPPRTHACAASLGLGQRRREAEAAAPPSRLHHGIKNKFWPTFQEGNLRQMGLGTFIAMLGRRPRRRWMAGRVGMCLPLPFLLSHSLLPGSLCWAYYPSILFFFPSSCTRLSAPGSLSVWLSSHPLPLSPPHRHFP